MEKSVCTPTRQTAWFYTPHTETLLHVGPALCSVEEGRLRFLVIKAPCSPLSPLRLQRGPPRISPAPRRPPVAAALWCNGGPAWARILQSAWRPGCRTRPAPAGSSWQTLKGKKTQECSRNHTERFSCDLFRRPSLRHAVAYLPWVNRRRNFQYEGLRFWTSITAWEEITVQQVVVKRNEQQVVQLNVLDCDLRSCMCVCVHVLQPESRWQ